MINISDKEMQVIKAILKEYLPDYEVRAFGSRVNGNSKPYSDLDLVVIGLNKIDLKTMFRTEEAFEESILPFRIDLLDWNSISESFQRIIEQKYKVIQAGYDINNTPKNKTAGRYDKKQP
jgi:predicted nucleotidyltransferase